MPDKKAKQTTDSIWLAFCKAQFWHTVDDPRHSWAWMMMGEMLAGRSHQGALLAAGPMIWSALYQAPERNLP